MLNKGLIVLGLIIFAVSMIFIGIIFKQDKKPKVVVVLKELDTQYWKIVKAGAKTIIRTDSPSGVFGHIHCTMRMGFVVDSSCEAFQVKRLYIADNSVLFNSLGSPNPTLTTQALATRTAEKLANKYFS